MGGIVWLSIIALQSQQHHAQAFSFGRSLRPRIQQHYVVIPQATEEAIVSSSSYTYTNMDPILTNALLDCSTEASTSMIHIGGIQAASQGIQIWRNALMKGRLPLVDEFDDDLDDCSTKTAWPAEPLFGKLCYSMVELQLPRFVLRHPETISVILLTLLRLTIDFAKRLQQENDIVLTNDKEDDDDDEEEDDWMIQQAAIITTTATTDESSLEQQEGVQDRIAQDVASELINQFGGAIRGVTMLDQLFGYSHDLLDVADNGDDDDDGGEGAGAGGFGFQDGIWQHTGWQMIPQLQTQIAGMSELRDLMAELGRRPTAEATNRQMDKFAPRKLDADGGMGAQFDPQNRDSVSGITLSNSLSQMLPSEAVLLCGSPGLRRLFLAKKAESKLMSYQLSGWTDVPSIPQTRPRSLRRMPSAPGGPVIVCLDTSWSMSGMREQLSKAVVLACVSLAHKQKRDCQVVAFSTERGTMASGILNPDSGDSIRRLLDFLSHSFGGGTDVTGALQYAMQSIIESHDGTMASADILLVTDGEIPDPPISDDLMEALDQMKIKTGVQVHGLLVGKRESKPLTRLSTKVHDFLLDYDTLATLGGDTQRRSTSALHSISSSSSSLRRRALGPQAGSHLCFRSMGFRSRQMDSSRSRLHSSISLRAKYSKYNDDNDDDNGYATGRGSKKNKNRNRQDDDDAEGCVLKEMRSSDGTSVSLKDNSPTIPPSNGEEYSNKVSDTLNTLVTTVYTQLEEQHWEPATLDEEKTSAASCWKYREELQTAIARVGEGLVEREEESRLVVLAMISGEHILLLGVPGTGKSQLGRRLSKLCGGLFFQRLLTRFTTPEEIFGPLSLKALENDEYRRCTDGFMPTASVAFLDEIFKANSAILNTLLTILNERKFDNGAGRQEDCPIRCVVGASNELPESDELDALYDRFLLRKEVKPVSDQGLMEMLSMSNPGLSPCADNNSQFENEDADCNVVFDNGLDTVVGALTVAINQVVLGEDTSGLMRDLRNFLRENQSLDVSDRRLVKAARLLKVSAASHGRSRVDPIDCLLLQHMTWDLPEQRAVVMDWLWEHLTPGEAKNGESASGSVPQFRLLLDGLRNEAIELIRKTGGDVSGASGGRKIEIASIQAIQIESHRIVVILKQKRADLARHMELLRRSKDHLWLDPDTALSAKQLLLPRAEAVANELDKALLDASSFVLCLSDHDDAPTNDIRLSVVEEIWEEGYVPEINFTEEELSIGMKEAKAKYDLETFRKWKKARKRSQS